MSVFLVTVKYPAPHKISDPARNNIPAGSNLFIAIEFEIFIYIPDHIFVLDLSFLQFDRHQKMQECISLFRLIRLSLKYVITFCAGKTWLMLYREFIPVTLKCMDRGITYLEFERCIAVTAFVKYFFHFLSSQGNNIVPAGCENSSVRNFSASRPFACAVEMIEYSAALAFAPFAVLLKSQFFLLCFLEHKRNYVLNSFMFF